MKRTFNLFFSAIFVLSTISFASAAGKVDFSYPDLEGKIHNLSDYRGKWVLVNYWDEILTTEEGEEFKLIDFMIAELKEYEFSDRILETLMKNEF